MNFGFNPSQGLIIVSPEIDGPTGRAFLQLAIDTGATHTLVNAGILSSIGYSPNSAATHVQITTASGVEQVPLIQLVELLALDQRCSNFTVLAHELPSSSIIDGVLGLDFFRGHVLNIDFPNGIITLS